MCGHYGVCLQLMSQCSFAVADCVMTIVGGSMLIQSVRNCHANQAVPFAVTVAATFFSSNLAFGAALGTLSCILYALFAAKSEGMEKVKKSSWILATAMLVMLVSSIIA